jgi:hypothetical protein
MGSFMTCTLHQIVHGWSNYRSMPHMGLMRCAFWISVGTPERKRKLGGTRHRWKNNIKEVCKYMFVYWIYLARDRDWGRDVVNTVKKLQIPWKGGYFLIRWATASFCRRTVLLVSRSVKELWCFMGRLRELPILTSDKNVSVVRYCLRHFLPV